jgi:transposase InsO family protein
MLKMIQDTLPEDAQIGRDKFFDLLRSNGLLVRKRRTRVYTTDSHHWLRKYPNLIKDITAERPNQIWVSDITYIKTQSGFVYLSLVTDVYSRKIIGWNLSDNMETKAPLRALHMAISQLPADAQQVIHHSDRGVQYCSGKYVRCLQKHHIKISMTENSDPYENAIAERVNGIIKTEWLYDIKLKDIDQAKKAIRQIIKLYNRKRPHYSVELLTPEQAHQTNGKLKRMWKTYDHKRLKQEISKTEKQ